jgi:hypothetical protein
MKSSSPDWGTGQQINGSPDASLEKSICFLKLRVNSVEGGGEMTFENHSLTRGSSSQRK